MMNGLPSKFFGFACVLIQIAFATCSGQASQLEFGCGAPVDPKTVHLDPDQLEAIDQQVKGWISEKRLVGCSAMVLRDGKVAYFRAWGESDQAQSRPITRETIFRIYSMSKPVTSVAAMQLVEQGRMELDDPLSKYLPAFEDMSVLDPNSEWSQETTDDLKTVRAEREVTIRDLLTHTSGLTYGYFGDTPVDREYKRQGVLFMDPNLKKMVEKLGSIPLLHQPGTRFHYSASTDVLGALVETVADKPFDQYLEESIFTVLKMKDTGFAVPKEKQPRLAEMYTHNDKHELILSPKWESFRFKTPANRLFSGGSGLCSTIDDYGRFAQMLVNGGALDGVRVIKESTLEAMFENQLDRIKEPPVGFRFGLGFSIGDRGTNGLDYAWGGAAGTRFWVNPKQRMAVLFMVQLKPTRGEFGEKVRDLAYEAIMPAVGK